MAIYTGIIVKLATRANLYYITLVEWWQILVSDLIHIRTYDRLASQNFTSIHWLELVGVFLFGIFHLGLISKLVWVLDYFVWSLPFLCLYSSHKVAPVWIVFILYIFISRFLRWFEIILNLRLLTLYKCVFLFHLLGLKLQLLKAIVYGQDAIIYGLV